VIFLIRDDRGKVNRLRTYLSWKDVRKKAKDDESGEAGADVDIDDAGECTQPWPEDARVLLADPQQRK
jgi:hypothetical protein